MVVAFKLQDQPPASVSTRQTQRAEHHFGGGIVKPHPLGAWDHALQPFRHLDLKQALRRPVRALARLHGDGIRHSRRGMTVENGPLANLEVNVLVAIDIEQPGALAVVEIQRHRHLHFANAAVDAAGNAPLGAGEQFCRFGKGIWHG